MAQRASVGGQLVGAERRVGETPEIADWVFGETL